jgi:hypothetical protein
MPHALYISRHFIQVLLRLLYQTSMKSQHWPSTCVWWTAVRVVTIFIARKTLSSLHSYSTVIIAVAIANHVQNASIFPASSHVIYLPGDACTYVQMYNKDEQSYHWFLQHFFFRRKSFNGHSLYMRPCKSRARQVTSTVRPICQRAYESGSSPTAGGIKSDICGEVKHSSIHVSKKATYDHVQSVVHYYRRELLSTYIMFAAQPPWTNAGRR